MGKPFYYASKCMFSVCSPFYPAKVFGKEKLQSKGRCIYASNHLSIIDIPLLQLHIPGYRRYVGKKEFLKHKFLSKIFSRFGVIFIDRDKPELSTMRTIFNVLDGDGQIMLFPEGTRNREDEKNMLELKNGLAIFASKSGASVIPVLIYRRPKFLHKNYIYVGDPLDICPNVGRFPNAELTDKLTKRYAYEFDKNRIILNDIVENKRWKKKNKLRDGEQCESLKKWLAENPEPQI